MTLSLLSVRSQHEVINSSKNNALNKGNSLSQLASGKKYNHPKDGISEYRTIFDIKSSLQDYNELLKSTSMYTSKVNIALDTTEELLSSYNELKRKINSLNFTLGVKNSHEYINGKKNREALQAEISTLLEKIIAIVQNSDFLGEKSFNQTTHDGTNKITEKTKTFYMAPHDDFTITTHSVDLFAHILTLPEQSGTTTATKLDGSVYKKDPDNTDTTSIDSVEIFKRLLSDDTLYDIFSSGIQLNYTDISTAGHENPFIASLDENGINFINSLTKSTVIENITKTIDSVNHNFQQFLSAMTIIDNSENLLKIQKTNLQAALSTIEDLDVQETMVKLMNEEILEQMSNEAMIKIKESSKYIIKLIQS